METIENKVFERRYPSSGCIFFPLGLLMLGLLLMLVILIIVSLLKSEPIKANPNNFFIIPILLILGGLVYFCFSRTFARIPIGIYPTHITIDNKKFSWLNVQNIVFSSWEKPNDFAAWKTKKHYAIRIELNNKKQTKIDIIVSIIILIVSISVGIMAYPKEGIEGSLKYATISFFLFSAMFCVNFFKPGSKQTDIESEDIDAVLDCTKYYADLYHIPLKNQTDKNISLDL